MIQPSLREIFESLSALLLEFVPPFEIKTKDENRLELHWPHETVIEGRQHKELYFAGIIIHENYVGFYYMPVYIQTGIQDIFKPRLWSLLKGKSCFHIKDMDDELKGEIRKALGEGLKRYRHNKWIK